MEQVRPLSTTVGQTLTRTCALMGKHRFQANCIAAFIREQSGIGLETYQVREMLKQDQCDMMRMNLKHMDEFPDDPQDMTVVDQLLYSLSESTTTSYAVLFADCATNKLRIRRRRSCGNAKATEEVTTDLVDRVLTPPQNKRNAFASHSGFPSGTSKYCWPLPGPTRPPKGNSPCSQNSTPPMSRTEQTVRNVLSSFFVAKTLRTSPSPTRGRFSVPISVGLSMVLRESCSGSPWTRSVQAGETHMHRRRQTEDIGAHQPVWTRQSFPKQFAPPLCVAQVGPKSQVPPVCKAAHEARKKESASGAIEADMILGWLWAFTEELETDAKADDFYRRLKLYLSEDEDLPAGQMGANFRTTMKEFFTESLNHSAGSFGAITSWGIGLINAKPPTLLRLRTRLSNAQPAAQDLRTTSSKHTTPSFTITRTGKESKIVRSRWH